MSFIRSLIPVLFFLLIILPSHLFAEENNYSNHIKPWQYRLGQGLRIAESDFFLGGYLSVKYYDDARERNYFEFDDLSFFLFGDIGEKVRFFSEMEDDEFYEIDTSGNSESKKSWQIERLYAEYLHSDVLHVRGGKFLTPVGTWNEVHADPLTWTVSRPPITEAAFPEFITGMEFYGNFILADEDMSYILMGQSGESIDEWTGFRKTHSLAGIKLKWFASPRFNIGVPLLYYTEYEIDDRVYLTGLDFTYKKSDHEIRFESTYSKVDLEGGGIKEEYGYYIMGVYGLTDKLFAVLRQDYLKMRESSDHHMTVDLGFTYKYKPQVVFKVEGQARYGDLVVVDELHLNDNERLLASFSLLL